MKPRKLYAAHSFQKARLRLALGRARLDLRDDRLRREIGLLAGVTNLALLSCEGIEKATRAFRRGY